MPTAKETILDVLELYKDMPFLWDKKHKEYTIQKRRIEGYNELLQVYKRYDENANIKILTKKLQNLRTNYIKEVKKIKESQQTGQMYVPTLYYFNALSFIGENSELCISIRDPLEKDVAYQIEVDDDHDSSSSETEFNRQIKIEAPGVVIPPQKKMKNTEVTPPKKRTTASNTAEEFLPSSPMTYEECEILGKAIGLQLRDLNKKQLMITQKLISDTIYYAKTGMLTENSFVAVVTPSNVGSAAAAPSTSSMYQYRDPQSSPSSPDH